MLILRGKMRPREIDVLLTTTDLKAAVRAFRLDYPDCELMKIDGKDVLGVCHCGMPVIEGTAHYRYDKDLGYLCPECNTLRR